MKKDTKKLSFDCDNDLRLMIDEIANISSMSRQKIINQLLFVVAVAFLKSKKVGVLHFSLIAENFSVCADKWAEDFSKVEMLNIHTDSL